MSQEHVGAFNSPNINGLIASLNPSEGKNQLSKESIAYLQNLIPEMKADEAKSKEFLRCISENPSLQIIAPTDRMAHFIRRWMTLPSGFSAEFEREQLRIEIRNEFPIQHRHYRAIAVEVGSYLHSMESLGLSPQSSPILAQTVQNAYTYCRWLRDHECPSCPADASMTIGQAIAAMTSLHNWLLRRADELEKVQAAPKPPKPVNANEQWWIEYCNRLDLIHYIRDAGVFLKNKGIDIGYWPEARAELTTLLSRFKRHHLLNPYILKTNTFESIDDIKKRFKIAHDQLAVICANVEPISNPVSILNWMARVEDIQQNDSATPSTLGKITSREFNDNQEDFLHALWLLKADNARTRKSTEEIVKKIGSDRDPANYKVDAAELAKRGLIETKTGRGGGCWLTPTGATKAEDISKR